MAFATFGVALVLSGIGGQPTVVRDAPPSPIRLVADATPSSGSFGIAGSRDGLFPGAETTIPIVLTNPNPFAIEVGRVATSASSDTPGCPVDNLSFGSLRESVVVAAHGSAESAVAVGMPHTAPDGCQGVTFRLTFTGSAGPAPGVVVPGDDAPASVLGSTQTRPGTLSRTGAHARSQLVVGSALLLTGALLTRVRRDGNPP